jgi:hypothetical protein
VSLFSRDRIPQWLLVVSTTAVGIWAGGRWLDPMSDAGFSWSLAWRLGRGELLYRDVHLVYGPLSPYLLALTGKPFGYSAWWYLLVNWIPAIAAGLLILEIGRKGLTVLEGIGLTLLILGYSLFAPGAGRLVLPYYAGVAHALVLSLCALLLLRAPPELLAARALAAGVLAGLAFACKPELGLAALGGLMAAAAGQMPRRAAWVARVLAGFGLVAAASFLFALSCDSLASLKQNSHLWPLDPTPPAPVAYLFQIVAGLTDPQWPLALGSAAFRLAWQLCLLALAAMLLARERPGRRWLPLVVLAGLALLALSIVGLDLLRPSSILCLSTLVAFLVAALAFLRRKTEGRTLLLAVAVFAGLVGTRTLFSGVWSGPYEGPAHLAQTLTWVLLLCVFAPPLLTGDGPAAPWARRLLGVAVLAAAALPAWDGMDALRFPWREPVATRRGTVFLDGSRAAFFRRIAGELHPGERTLILPETSAVDVLFDAPQSSPFLNHLPGWFDAAVERRLIARLEGNPPAAVVIFDRPVGEFGVKPFGSGYGSLLSEWCRSRYVPVVETPAGVILRPPGRPENERKPPPR